MEEIAKKLTMEIAVIFTDKVSPRQLEEVKNIIQKQMENLTKHNSRNNQSARDEICDLHNVAIKECGCAGSLEDKAD